MTDIHCHLTHFSTTLKGDEVSERADNLGIDIIDCITQPDLWEQQLRRKNVFYSIGIHPRFIKKRDYSKEYSLLEKLSDQIVMIGEIGFDKTNKEMKKQEEVFFNQISIANNNNLPILIHCYGFYDKLYKELKKLKFQNPVIIHRYNGGDGQVNSFVRIGCYLSYSIDVLYNKKIRKSFEKTPIDNILVETDAPYLKNKDSIFYPYDLPYLYNEMSKIKKSEKFNDKIENNCKTIFK